MKNVLKIIVFLFLVLVLFRGPVFRTIIKYKPSNTRQEFQITNQKLLSAIASHSKNKTLNQDEVISIATSLTIETLSFSMKYTSSDPNKTFNTNKANCVGYAALFNSIANYLIGQNELSSILKAKHQVGHLELFGLNVHSFIKSPFFKDHDYNQIKNLITGEIVLIDATVTDYMGIERVR